MHSWGKLEAINALEMALEYVKGRNEDHDGKPIELKVTVTDEGKL